jgi:hypothetical protein
MKKDYILEDNETMAPPTERTDRLAKEDIFKFKTFMESGEKFLEYSELLTGRTETIEIINVRAE